jgi:hypothetical protein
MFLFLPKTGYSCHGLPLINCSPNISSAGITFTANSDPNTCGCGSYRVNAQVFCVGGSQQPQIDFFSNWKPKPNCNVSLTHSIIFIPFAALCPGVTYQFRAREQISSGQNGAWTCQFTFTVPGTPIPLNLGVSANPNPICSGSSALTVSASGGCGNYSYSWSPSTGLSSTSGSSVTATPSTTTTYTVTATTSCGQSTSRNVTVTVLPSPLPGTISASSASVCDGESVNLSISGNTPGTTIEWERSCNGGNSWLQLGGGTSISNVLNLTNPSLQSTCCFRAKVRYNYANSNCPTVYTNQVCVTVSPKPNVTANLTPNNVCEGEIINLSSNATPMGQGPFSYSWTPATGVSNPNAQNTTAIAPLGTTTYTVTATNQWGCSNTASATTNNVKPCPCDKYEVFDYNNITVNGTEIWNLSGRTINGVFSPWPVGVNPNNIKIKGKITVMPNSHLSLIDVTIAFGASGMIEIRRAGIGLNSTGGNVVTNNVKLTAVANCMWWGVDVWGWSAELPGQKQGTFTFRSSVMEHAAEGIFVGRRQALISMQSSYIGFNPTINYSGGTISVMNSTFNNCKNSINFPLPYSPSSSSQIFGCNFICDAPLRQAQIYASTWNYSQRSEHFIRVIGMTSGNLPGTPTNIPPNNIIGTGNTFSNTPASITNSNNNTIAVFSDNSLLPVSMCTFNNVDKGVYLTSVSGTFTSRYWVYGNQFNQNATAISAIGIAKLDVRQNTINNGVWPMLSLMGTSLGVYMNNISYFSCYANNINNVEHAITLLNSKGPEPIRSVIQKNIINNCIQGIALGGDNEYVDIHCNEISNYSLRAWNVYDFPLSSGNAKLSNQFVVFNNNPVSDIGAGNLFNDLGSITDIRVLTSNPLFTQANPLFTYYFDGGWNPQVNPLMPDVIIGPVSVQQININPESISLCGSMPPIAPPNPVDSIRPRPRDRDSILADLINTNDTLLQQRYRLELADYAAYYQEDSLLFATLQSINTESAQRLLTGTYIAKEMEVEAAQSLALIPQNTFEKQKFHEYINLMRGQIQAGRNVYLSEPQEEQQIRSIAPLKPAPGIHAQNAITVLAFEPMPIDCEHLGICDNQKNRIENVNNAQQEQSDKISNAIYTTQEKTKIITYPNPNSGTFTIQIDNAINGNYLIEVIDLRGIVVYKHSYSIEEQSHLHYIRLNEQGKGLYFIKITSNENQFTHISKIVVQ